MRWNRSLSHVALLGACLALTLSACGSATPLTNAAPTTTATAAAANASPTTQVKLPAGCADMPSGPQWLPLAHVGDLIVTQATFGLTYPAYQIPQGTASRPLKLSDAMLNPAPGALPINPSMKETGGGFVFAICNASTSRSDTVQSVSVRVASFQPFSGVLAAWSFCADGFYDAQSRSLGAEGGCGGGLSVNEALHAAFPGSAGVGASVTATQTSTNATGPNQPDPFPALPLSVAPGHDILVNVGLTVPTAPGTYTFAFGLAVGSAAPAYFATSAPGLFAPITQEWSGSNCGAATMKAQIPAATQPTYYICPPSA